MKPWLDIDPNSDFSIYNIPFGIAVLSGERQIVSRIGDHIIMLDILQDAGVFGELDLPYGVFIADSLNEMIGLGKPVTKAIRETVQRFFSDRSFADSFQFDLNDILIHADLVQMALPVRIGDYTDFYSSREHATNVGIMFRGPDNALMPNWLHLPVAYHGRASSIVVSGTDFKRPAGQILDSATGEPYYSRSKELDIEVEMAFVIGKPTALGESVPVSEAESYIFGFLLFNDWSARDLQRWEYVPLGPFLAKNFASTVSPWIVTLEALEPFRTSGPVQEKEVLEYLRSEGPHTFDIAIKAVLTTSEGIDTEISNTNYKYLYWNACQQLAHHTVNGCNINIGDVMASGTISGQDQASFGSLLELSWKGTRPIRLNDGTERTFLEDGDSVTLSARAVKGDIVVGFGQAEGRIIS